MGASASQARSEKSGGPHTNNNNNNFNNNNSEEQILCCEGWIVPKCVRAWSSSAINCNNEIQVPAPGPNEVRIKVYAASVNPVDVKRVSFGHYNTIFGRSGNNNNNNNNNNNIIMSGGRGGATSRHPALEFPFPYVMGVDGAGIIESVGWSKEDLTQQNKYNLKVGDRVAFLADITKAIGGSFSQYAVVHADAVGKIPSSIINNNNNNNNNKENEEEEEDIIDFVEAAAMPCAVGTAYVALFDKLSVESGRSILISGASGGVGSAAIQLAKHAGLSVLASCSTRNINYVKELGADFVFDYTAVDVVGECLRYTQGFGVDYVLEIADASLATYHSDALRFGGSICVLPSHIPNSSDIFFRRQLSLSYVFLGGLYSHELTRGNLKRVIEAVLLLYKNNIFRLEIETVPIERADTALDIIASGHTRGKIVLTNFHPDDKEQIDSVIGTRRRRKHGKKQIPVKVVEKGNGEGEEGKH